MSLVEKVVRLSKNSLEMLVYNSRISKYRGQEKYKNMWLISERGVEAKDNGYVFFKYLRENHPEINAWYVIDSSHKKDYDRVKNLGNIIEYGSDEHKIAFLLCEYAISSHLGFLEPWSYKLYKLLLDRKDKKKFVLLQHGIILSDLSMYYNASNKIDLFITTTKREYESICGPNYGFDDGVVVRTGIARYDRLNEFKTKKQILLMPTWRQTIITPSYKKQNKLDMTSFISSDYFKSLNSLINNKELSDLLDKYDRDLIFYPHFEMQPYKGCFDLESSRFVLADKDDYDVQTLLKESELLITDFSSVAFDFAYMKKPLIYYQKVKDDKYEPGYFNYELDGFGDIILDEESLVDKLSVYLENEFMMEDKYVKRVDEFFDLRDGKNCDRIFEAVLGLEK
ncbi:teichoic acid biosynthesis protein B [Peptostreptococcus sp. MV1]|uniref:CDP-glycerol glycerophosphotransferase family protein n=1 Tax=Peptostreptococcus sp. MV1 TaxID=1219626 RepID=UPI00050F0682|nr:CDP-glycerol glycerophosphotransferase family protein [Peptostreptococcus sp. MV1]KGF13007.1 teichoic acid biosynthesis protein B [Peptostreptococcus sp. MV1]